jgi:protein-disulfide isomerase
MSSRVEAKQRLRDQRIAQERDREEKERRKRRVWTLAGAGGVAALVVVALIVVSQSGGGGSSSAPSGLGSGDALAGTADVRTLYAGIPQSGATVGKPDAPLTMVEFVDLQCPFCRQYTTGVLPTIVQKYVRTGKLRIELRPLAFIGEDSQRAAAAAAEAAKENRLWQFTDLFYLNQGQENSGYVTDDFLRQVAQGSGAKPGAVVAAANGGTPSALVTQAADEAAAQKIDSTPSFLLGPTGGKLERLKVERLEPGAFSGPIDQALAR